MYTTIAALILCVEHTDGVTIYVADRQSYYVQCTLQRTITLPLRSFVHALGGFAWKRQEVER